MQINDPKGAILFGGGSGKRTRLINRFYDVFFLLLSRRAILKGESFTPGARLILLDF